MSGPMTPAHTPTPSAPPPSPSVTVGRRSWLRRATRALAVGVALSLVSSVLVDTPALAAPPGGGSKAPAPRSKSVAVTPLRARRPVPASQTDGKGVTSTDRRTLPGAGHADVAVSGVPTKVGQLPVTLSAPVAPHAAGALVAPVVPQGPAAVRMVVADQKIARALKVAGVVMSVSRADQATTAAPVHARFDYGAFANAYGSDYGSRLRLVGLPACAVSTPSVPACAVSTDLESVNDPTTTSVTADLTVSAATTVVALASSAVSQAADWTATSLKPAYSWAAGDQGGTFDYTYPLDAPDGLGGPAPDLKLTYNSGAVDGQTLAQNGQTSWVGEGWDLQAGYIERSYRPCKDDNVTGLTVADECWFSNNATMVFGGESVSLVYDDTTHVWHASDDHALKIDQVYGTGTANTPGDNGTYNHEYWRVTSQDGTQYFFGINHRYAGDTAVTNGALGVLVYGDSTGEPCYTGQFNISGCQQGYRWNLDYVVDAHGNSMTTVYDKFSGIYGANNNTWMAAYDLSATVNHIDYGTRAGSEGSTSAPMRIQFQVDGRCYGTCTQAEYPDTPWDQYCATGSTTCAALPAPVFWNPNKLSAVTAQVLNGGSYRSVDRWDLAYTYPSSGDYITPTGNDTSPNLWLQSITHTGYNPDGSGQAEVAVTFGGTRYANRIFWGNSINVAPYMHYRITEIDNGVGGATLVAYNASDCDGSFTPTPDSNPYRCFPQYIKPQIAAAGWTWFAKYTVASVTDHDITGGSPDVTTSYAYFTTGSSTTALWHHDTQEAVSMDYRSWSLWRGYSTLTATKGTVSGQQTVTTSLYYRGMNGDRTKASGWNSRVVTVVDSQTSGLVDSDALAGRLREETHLDGSTVLESTIHTPTVTQTASRAAPNAYTTSVPAFMVTETDVKTRTWLAASSAWRWDETQTAYNAYDLPTVVTDLNDTSVATDDTCTTTAYVTPDTTNWLIDFPAQVITTDCAASPTDASYQSGSQTFYDGSTTVGATPTQGLETKTLDLATVSGGVLTWKPNTRTDYDTYGRPTASYDALERKTATAYTPASGGPVTATTKTDPMGWTTTTTLDPGHGSKLSVVDVNSKTTTARYDPLGRLTTVWSNNRPTSATPDLQYTYALSNTAPNWVQTQKLGPTGAQIASYAIYDGQLRLRQNQDATPAATGGRWIIDTGYDTRGLKATQSSFFNATATPSGTLGTFAATDVPTQDRLSYDGQERELVDAFYSTGILQWQTSHSYDGDRDTEIAPTGGVSTQKLLDTRGNTIELRQLTAPSTTASYQATKYTYDRDNKLVKTTDAAGNTWTATYDLRGREVGRSDPDSGSLTSSYDDADQLLSTTRVSAAGVAGTTLAYTYDTLGRKTSQWKTATSTASGGTQLASWTYDTLAKDQLTSSTRWQGGDPYTTTVSGYDDAYRPLGESVSIPASAGSALAGSWAHTTTYAVNGAVATTGYPAVGAMAAETVTNSYDANGFQLTSAGMDTYLSAASYQPWGGCLPTHPRHREQTGQGHHGRVGQHPPDQDHQHQHRKPGHRRNLRRTTHPGVHLDSRRHDQRHRHSEGRDHHRLPVFHL